MRKAWIVLVAGVVLNLALGVLYAWSVFSKQLSAPLATGGYGWTETQATLPYVVAIASFALMMVPAGRLQDRLGPRLTASLGAILCGLGLAVASRGTPGNIIPTVVGFGLLSGTGFGLGYAAATPAAVKWYGPHKKGLVTGIVVAGFGVAPVYIAPLSSYLLSTQGISRAFLILGGLFLVVAGLAAQLLRNPETPVAAPAPAAGKPAAASDVTWREVLKRPVFYSLYLQYACAATAGLMIIGKMAKIVLVQSHGTIKTGFLFVAVLAIFNASGRVIAGVVSDRIGRAATLTIVFLLQAATMFVFKRLETVAHFFVGASVAGFSYGACLSLFPASAADRWGTKNLGLNYGILFTAWGVGGVFGPMLLSRIYDSTKSYDTAYLVACGLLVFAAVLAQGTRLAERRRA